MPVFPSPGGSFGTWGSTLRNFFGTVFDLATGKIKTLFTDTENVEQYADFATAVTTIGSNVKTLVIPSLQTVAGNVTVPSTLTLQFIGTGGLSVNATFTITINGPLDAPLRQVFSGTGAVALGVIAAHHFHASWFGDATDSGKVNSAITAVKAGGGIGHIIVPSSMDNTFKLPSVNLTSANQAIILEDRRVSRANETGGGGFGALLFNIDATDSSSGHAGEIRLQSLQNPGLVLRTFSDGTVASWTKAANHMGSIVWAYGAVDAITQNWQILTDMTGSGQKDIGMLLLDAASTTTALHIAPDNSDKPRVTISPVLMETQVTTITDATNTSPIVITTSTPHGGNGVHFGVSVSGVLGNTAANGSWLGTALTTTTIRLDGSTGNGAWSSGGTQEATTTKNDMRATLNVPPTQGGTEAIYSEGIITSKRFDVVGTLLVAGDFALSSGWGTTATVTGVSGNDHRGEFTVNSLGTGQGANPTITLTFTNGTWGVVPFGIVMRNPITGDAQISANDISWTRTATTIVITWHHTPVASDNITFSFMMLG